ncbi:ATP-grasp domain-containing protein, partial [Limosilactobacillus fermentum]
IGYPSVLKTCEGGYDGHGQVILKSAADLAKCTDVLATGNCILEGWVKFDLECSVMVARNANQEIVTFPVSENIHQNEILHLSIVPARISTALQERAREMAKQIAEQLDLKGILGVE